MAEQRPSPQAGPFLTAEQGAISASRCNLRRLSHVHRAEQRAISAARSYLRRLASRHAIGRCMVPSGQAIGRCLPRKQLTRPELSSGSHGQGGGCLSPRAGLSKLRRLPHLHGTEHVAVRTGHRARRPEQPCGSDPSPWGWARNRLRRLSCLRRLGGLQKAKQYAGWSYLRRLNHIHMAEQRPSPQAGPFQRAEQGANSAG